MIRQEQIRLVIDSQRENFLGQEPGMRRDRLDQIPIVDAYATIITGIRRCGKSTLLLQLLRAKYQDAIYLNFEDIRLSGFEIGDFVRLHKEIEKRDVKVLFFDEIQLVKQWEHFINQLLREDYKVFITGSNASMLSVELGTHLTGRHISMELFPFSYSEYIRYKEQTNTNEAIKEYLHEGGIPEYVKSGVGAILNMLLDDILVRDIAVRHALRDVNSLRQLAVYLITNVGNLVSANKLEGMFGIKSASTLLEYFSYMKDSYLIDLIPQFSHSLKTQARNPRKVYVMDMGLYTQNSNSTSDNEGHRLENLVFLYLRRKYKEIYYFKQKGECDFLTFENGRVKQAVQVCLSITDENFDREYNGLIEAMDSLELSEGVIVTFDQEDLFDKDGKTVRMVPAAQFLIKG